MRLVFTDGSCLKNPGGRCGWSFVVVEDGCVTHTESDSLPDGTNNIAELTACINAVNYISHNIYQGRTILVSDSRYVLNGLMEFNTHAEPPYELNYNLWYALLQAVRTMVVTLEVCWVKGHAGNPANELCDKMAKTAAIKQKGTIWQKK